MRSWFRRTVLRAAQAAGEAPPPEAQDPQAARVEEAPPASEPAEDGEKPRRAPRRGQGRKKPDQPPGKAEAEPAAKAAGRSQAPAKEKAAPATKKAAGAAATAKAEAPKRERRRRAETPRRTSSPAVRKQMLVSVDTGEQRVAVLEDDQVVEVYLERPGRRSIAGNVYKGVVDNVLPGMEASFVDIGLEKNGFLYVDEIVVPELEGRRHGRRIQDLVSRGQEVLVQAVKDPMGTKGARLTTEISLPGRFLVYTPFGDGIGVSRRLEEDERERLKALCKTLELPEGGIIVRTAAEGASEEELTGDLAFLRKLWSTIQARAARTKAPALVYQEAELPLRVVRDVFRSDFERLAVDHERTYRRITSYLKRTSRELAERVEWYREAEPLMERHGVDAAVRSTLERRVDLPSGGYLVFDYAEAFTVVDVNTGRFVGARGKSSVARLEDTITKNNLEAVREIVRQLRLRDIGGIIVIDFIDMANPKNRREVEEALRRELERDRTKTYVVEISPLGLVEMTRQNVTDGPREILTRRCPVCGGDGVVVSEETYAVEAERRLRRLAAASKAEAFLVELPSRVASILIGPAGSRLAEIERETGRTFAFETSDRLPPDHFALLREGTAAEIEPHALPVSPGQEVELELLEVHMHHPADAVARLDGYVIAVADAAGRVGEKVRARIERATRTVAYAVLAGEEAAPAEGPVEAGDLAEQDEEEASRSRKGVARGGRTRRKAGAPAAGEPGAAEEAAEGAGTEEAETPKRKTRRGTRGGRGRRKPDATEALPEEPAAEELAGEAEPEPAAGEAAEKPKKKTRRGTRGGRGRKKAPAAAASNGPAAGSSGVAAVEPARPWGEGEPQAAPEPAGNGAEEAERSKEPSARSRRGQGRRPSKAAVEEPVAADADAG